MPAKQSGTDTPEDRVLQGEVLNDGKRKPNAESASSRYTFEQQTRNSRPDLSGLNTSSRKAIQSYLDNEDLGSPFFSARPLIDEYV